MAVLLDTQVLIWTLFGDRRLSATAANAIAESEDVFISVASIYEIDFKRRDPARLRAQDSLLRRMPRNMPAILPRLGYTLLPIDAETAWRAARLPIAHGDPWDRLILCQAVMRALPLVSADAALAEAAAQHASTVDVIVF